MPTEKPRITITVDEELHKKISDYQFSHRIKNQTQAVVTLIEIGMKELLSSNSDSSVPIAVAESYTKKESETNSDPNLSKLLDNYENMNLTGQYALADYSDFLAGKEEYRKHSKIPDIKQA